MFWVWYLIHLLRACCNLLKAFYSQLDFYGKPSWTHHYDSYRAGITIGKRYLQVFEDCCRKSTQISTPAGSGTTKVLPTWQPAVTLHNPYVTESLNLIGKYCCVPGGKGKRKLISLCFFCRHSSPQTATKVTMLNQKQNKGGKRR